MGGGPGKGGGTDLTEVTGDSEDTTERLRTQEVEIPLGIPIVLKVGVVPTGGLKVGESGGPAIGSTATTGPGIGIHISCPWVEGEQHVHHLQQT
jgi:hypothetical protein